MREYISLIFFLFLSGCSYNAGKSNWQNAQQMIVVVPLDWQVSSGKLSRFERYRHKWHKIGKTISVSLGKKGTAWGIGLHPVQQSGIQKREGDQRSPAGIFAIGTGFGYGACQNCKIPYHVMTEHDVCIDQPDSPYYNKIVNIQILGKQNIAVSHEVMRRDLYYRGDQLYKLGFTIGHNMYNDSRHGSCIFAHLRQVESKATAGCTAMDESEMKIILSWLDLYKNPVFVLLPLETYKEKQKIWQLPKL